MAIRTISTTGGAFGATTSWVEGIVPVDGDDIIGNSASGNLALNLFTQTWAMGSLQFDNGGDPDDNNWYRGVFSMGSFLGVIDGGVRYTGNGTVSFSPFMRMTSARLGFFGFFQPGTSSIIYSRGFTHSECQLQFGNGTKTLGDDFNIEANTFYVATGNNIDFVTNLNLNSSGTASMNIYGKNPTGGNALTISFVSGRSTGSAQINFKQPSDSGTININTIRGAGDGTNAGKLNLDLGAGTLNIINGGILDGGNIEYISGTISGSRNFRALSSSAGETKTLFKFSPKIDFLSMTALDAQSINIQLDEVLNVERMSIIPQDSASSGNQRYILSGTYGLSASYLYISPSRTLTATSSYAPDVMFATGSVNNIGNLYSYGLEGYIGNKIKLRTSATGSSATLNVFNSGNVITNTEVLDLNNNGTMVYALEGSTITSTTGFKTNLEIGGTESSNTFLL